MFEGFRTFAVDVGDVVLRGRCGGREGAPGLLLLHGHPQTHVMWHRVAPALAEDFLVMAPDLRGYGESGRPAPTADHRAHSKRAMAADAVALMAHFGVERFGVVGHDRGGRVAARLVADHPGRVSAAVLLDIAPTLDMYAGTDREFATAYWHWFFLIQPAPLPETLIGANPRAYVEGVLGGRHAGLAPFPAEVLDAYVAGVTGTERAAGICEDYRAAATCDLVDDAADRAAGHRIGVPLRVVWAQHGVVGRRFDPLSLWRALAVDVSGRSLPCGHYLPEERPDEVIAETRAALATDLPTDLPTDATTAPTREGTDS